MAGKDDLDVLTLRIKKVTPQTLPMKRLLTYLSKLTELLGSDSHVHLLRVARGSAAPKIAVDRVARNKVIARCRAAGSANGPPELVRIRAELDSLFAEDRTSAALIDRDGSNILSFPGHRERDQEQITVFEQGSIRGRVLRVGGKDETVPMLLETEPGRYQRCVTTRDTARDIIKHYEKDIEVHGRGKWHRGKDGTWSLEEFIVRSFVPLEGMAGILDTLNELSAAEGSGWNSLEDPFSAHLSDRYGPHLPEGASQ